MIVEIDLKVCDRCGGCVAICPELAIDISEYLVMINQEECTACQMCVKFCPVGAIINVEE